MSSFGSVSIREFFPLQFWIAKCLGTESSSTKMAMFFFPWVNVNFFPLGEEAHKCMQKMNLTVRPILAFSDQFRKSVTVVMTSRNNPRADSMPSVSINKCLCDHVKKSHTGKKIKAGLKLHCLSGYLVHLDDILQDSSAKGTLSNDNFKQRFQLSSSILQTRQSVAQIKAAKASTELAKGDKKSILVSCLLDNRFLPLTLLRGNAIFSFHALKSEMK